jgi:hypothetical protein
MLSKATMKSSSGRTGACRFVLACFPICLYAFVTGFHIR